MATPEVHALITEVMVCVLPNDHEDYEAFAIKVQWRGDDRYAVKRLSRVLGIDGKWSYEPNPSSRDDEWIAGHRFSYHEAMALAVKAAPHVAINGLAVGDVTP